MAYDVRLVVIRNWRGVPIGEIKVYVDEVPATALVCEGRVFLYSPDVVEKGGIGYVECRSKVIPDTCIMYKEV